MGRAVLLIGNIHADAPIMIMQSYISNLKKTYICHKSMYYCI